MKKKVLIHLSAQKGISLLEAIFTIAAVSIIVILLASIPNSINLITKSSHLSIAREVASNKLESLRESDYSSLAITPEDSPSAFSDSRLNQLPNGFAEYEISECDDNICTQNEDIKMIKVRVTWKENNKVQDYQLETLVTSGGI